MKDVLKKVVSGVVLTVATSANAAVIDYNDVIANTFHDDSTGLTWLDVSQTGWNSFSRSSSGYYYSSNHTRTIQANLDMFSDFRIATESEVHTLVVNIFDSLTFDSDGNYSYSDSWVSPFYGGSGGDRSQPDPLFAQDYNDLLSIAGGYTSRSSYSYRDGDRRYTSILGGLYLTDNGGYGSLNIKTSSDTNYSTTSSGWRILRSESDSSSITFQDLTYDPTGSHSPLWMIYDPTPVSVSEPSSLAILGLGLAGLGFARRKSKA